MKMIPDLMPPAPKGSGLNRAVSFKPVRTKKVKVFITNGKYK